MSNVVNERKYELEDEEIEILGKAAAILYGCRLWMVEQGNEYEHDMDFAGQHVALEIMRFVERYCDEYSNDNADFSFYE